MWRLLAAGALLAVPPTAALAAEAPPLDVEACVALALAQNPRLDEAAAKVDFWRAKLREVESIYYPKLQAQALLAPMFTIEGTALEPDVEKRWRSIRHWGPYSQLELTLVQPLYTFGRAQAGSEAAKARAAVEQARLRRTENAVALEVRKLYYGYLFARSVQPTLEWADEQVTKALDRARKWLRAGNGKVSTVDISKLEYADAQLDQLRVKAVSGAELALSALKFTLGYSDDVELRLADERLPQPVTDNIPSLGEMLYKAAMARPEWQEIREGRNAALRLADAERLANAPTLFLAGRASHRWAPTVDNQTNPFHNDPYNGGSGGVALGLRFDLDPHKAASKSQQALAQVAEIDALARFAHSGIPLEVRRAYMDLEAAVANFAHVQRGRRAARKWAFFASSAFLTGAGSAKDVIDGIVAYLEATRSYYEGMLAVYTAEAQLQYAVGLPPPGASTP